MKTNKLLIIPAALVTTTLLTGLILSSTITKADGNTSSTDTISITVDSACTMMGGPTGESTTDNTYTATIDPGTYQEISGSKLVTLCNDSEGYSIYAIGFSGDSYDSNTHTDLIGTGSIGNIQTGTTGSNSYWAMKLQAVEGLTPPTILNGFNDYHVIPSSYTQIAKQETATASPSSAGASVQTKYKVNIASSQTAGTYTGKVKYTMVHPNNITPPPTGSIDAAYFEAGKTKHKGYYTMQDMEPSMISRINDFQTGTLIDTRDDSTYTIAKIAGAIWMTQNLRIAGVIPANGSNFTGNDVNISECDLDKTVGECSESDRSSDDIAMTHYSGDTTHGVWYNYAAASAKTVTGQHNYIDATSDICPTGWHMPSYDTSSPAGSVNSLIGLTQTERYAFRSVTSGIYQDGRIMNQNYGNWWTKTTYNAFTSSYELSCDVNKFCSASYITRQDGLHIRCVKTS